MSGASLLLALALPALGAAAAAPAAVGLDPGKALTQFSVDTWTTADLLPQNSVTAIVQTRDGYLWLGTYGGLVRFDGVRFTVFDVASGALRSNGVQALLEDRDGALWIGTNGGGLSRHRAGRFETFTKEQGLAHDIVRTLFQDAAGAVWAGTNDGLSRFEEGGFRSFTTRDGLANGVVRALATDGTGALVVGTNGGGLDRFQDGRFEHFTTRDGLPNDFVFALHHDRAGDLWIGTNGGGLARRGRDGRLRVFTVKDGLPSNIVWSLHEDGRGSLWVGTYGGGIARLRDGRIESLTTATGLPNDFVRALHSDREGGLWVGTYSGGLCRLRDGKFTNYTTREGLSYDFVRTALEDRSGTLWVGTTGGGLCRLREGRFRCLGPSEGMGADVRALHEGPDGALWVGTAGSGLLRLDDRGLASFGRADGLPHQNVTAITDDGEGGLLLGTNGGGVARFRAGRIEPLPEGAGHPFVLSLLRDRAGAVWAGTDGAGLSVRQNGKVSTYTARDGLGGDIVFALHQDGQGELWAGTSGGLSLLGKDGSFTTFGAAQGLTDDVVFSVLEDATGDFWLGGNRGITRVSRAELLEVAAGRGSRASVIVYGRADGMLSDECSGVAQPASWRGKDGRLYFPTARGVVMADPARMPRNTVPPPVHVEEVVVDGQPLQGRLIPPGRQRFEFRYTALSLLAPRKVQFRYRLEGFDTEWIEGGSQRAAFYTRLPPGSYTFRVVASNNDGVWNEEGASLAVTVRPYFWETRWFQALVALGLVGLGALGYAHRVRRLEHARRELRALVEVRTADLVLEKERSESARAEAERQRELAQEADRLKSELMSIAAHDLKTPLQSIIGYSELLLEQPTGDRVREYATQASRAAQRMLDIVHRMLQSDAIESGQLRPERGVVDLGRLSLATAGILQPQAEAKKQRIHAGVEGDCRVEGDEDWLRQVLENLLGNAIKYSAERRSIWLEVRRTGDLVRLTVKDEGPGLSDDDKARVFGRFQRLSARPTGGESSTGLGLSIVRQLVERHGGRVYAESEGRGKGTTFVVEVPALPATLAS